MLGCAIVWNLVRVKQIEKESSTSCEAESVSCRDRGQTRNSTYVRLAYKQHFARRQTHLSCRTLRRREVPLLKRGVQGSMHSMHSRLVLMIGQ